METKKLIKKWLEGFVYGKEEETKIIETLSAWMNMKGFDDTKEKVIFAAKGRFLALIDEKEKLTFILFLGPRIFELVFTGWETENIFDVPRKHKKIFLPKGWRLLKV